MTDLLDPEGLARQLTFAVTLLALLVGHQVGDHVLQSDHQAAEKAQPGWAGARAMAGHLIAYHLTLAAVLGGTALALAVPLRLPGVLSALAFSVVTHAVLDRRTVVRAVLRATRSPGFATQTSPVCGMYVADQALHWLALLVCAVLLAVL